MTNTTRGRGQRAMTSTQWAIELASIDSLKKPLTTAEQALRLGVTPQAVTYQRKKLAATETDTFVAA